MIFARKIIKIPEFFMIIAGKMIKIPEFYMIFARKMPEFYIIITRKIFFPEFFFFWGGGWHVPRSLPPSLYAYCRRLMNINREHWARNTDCSDWSYEEILNSS